MKRKKDLHMHGAPPDPPPRTGNPPPPTGNRQLPPLAPQNQPRPRNPMAPTTAYCAGKKRKRSSEKQKCALCRQPGHNRARCPSTIANMFANPASSSVMGDNQGSSSTVKKS
ncbi:espin-like [Salvia hispanica]|uniref:espin-like n=1 Tax=Salvia hispanica TaxID=49212 RepID=UPI0020096FBD|nr:espin-like [Salvia hispanica]